MFTSLKALFRRSTTENVAADLSALGSTPTDVAGTLAILGIKGYRRDTHACPITNYLKKKGHHNVSVSAAYVYVGKRHDTRIRISTPEAVRQFINAFDNGDHPELEA